MDEISCSSYFSRTDEQTQVLRWVGAHLKIKIRIWIAFCIFLVFMAGSVFLLISVTLAKPFTCSRSMWSNSYIAWLFLISIKTLDHVLLSQYLNIHLTIWFNSCPMLSGIILWSVPIIWNIWNIHNICINLSIQRVF